MCTVSFNRRRRCRKSHSTVKKVIPVFEMLPASLSEIRLSIFWGSVERSVRRAHLLLDLLSHCEDAGVHPVSEGEARKQHHVSLSTAAWPSFRNMAFRKQKQGARRGTTISPLSRHTTKSLRRSRHSSSGSSSGSTWTFLFTIQSDEPVFL